MGTAAAEGKAGGDGPRDELGFRRRGDRTTRLEAFVDAAFAFALSLMVIAVGSVPRSPEELSVALKGVPAFAACFWLIANFWRGHVDWSERFGLDDPRSRQWSLLLIFLALIFIFPLKIVFAVFFDWISGGALPSKFPFETADEVRRMFQTFAIAFGSMGAVLWALNHQAWRQRDLLALDAAEVASLRLVMRLWALVPLFSLVSLGLSLWTPSLRYGAPGMIFFLMHAVQVGLRMQHRRRLASALASSAA